ncbi:CIC11C00000004719 [Sungouiella intermedia]|uniref:CIC11C00000004719 n=1 Tax=Sungouiella intermedia TaxID=45354 RepID=A0A1L0DJ42_9ASCO|nr:CIC11C00000004719 [[Candida] intermedia]
MTTKVIVFGSHGKIGQRLIKLIAETTAFTATAVVRNAEQASEIKKLSKNSENITTTELTLTDASVLDLAGAIKGHDAVVLSVGSAGKDLLKVDLDGVVKAFEASVEANVRRLVLISAVFANDREFGSASGLHNYYIAKHHADRILRHEFGSQLDYTILKPSRLLDGDGTGKIKFLSKYDDPGHVQREDVAKAIFEVLNNKNTFGKAYDFCEGDLPIDNESTWKQ